MFLRVPVAPLPYLRATRLGAVARLLQTGQVQ
jgi:hypothetical protein